VNLRFFMCKNLVPDNGNVIKTYDDKYLDISDLSINELWLLHYEQEKTFAKLIKEAKAFSYERTQLMKRGYETVSKIMILRKIKESNKWEKYSNNPHFLDIIDELKMIKKTLNKYLVKNIYLAILKKIIKKVLRKKNECVFFEAGVGNGKIIKEITKIYRVKAIGCDVFVDKNYIDVDIGVTESSIYNALQNLEDNSIDVFYWNDVMEHIPEDEIREHLDLLSKKMAKGGIIITVTPNRLIGPWDITAHFEPQGTVAKGFHFHEYTFKEILDLFEEYNIVSAYGIFSNPKKGWYILGAPWMDRIKLYLEKSVYVSPSKIKNKMMIIAGCDISLLKKNN